MHFTVLCSCNEKKKEDKLKKMKKKITERKEKETFF